ELQSRKLARDPVIVGRAILVEIREAVCSGNREPGRIIQPGIVKPPVPAHLEHGYERIPVCDGAPGSAPRVLVESGQAVRIRNECRTRDVGTRHDPIRHLPSIEGLSVEEYLGVELARLSRSALSDGGLSTVFDGVPCSRSHAL